MHKLSRGGSSGVGGGKSLMRTEAKSVGARLGLSQNGHDRLHVQTLSFTVHQPWNTSKPTIVYFTICIRSILTIGMPPRYYCNPPSPLWMFIYCCMHEYTCACSFLVNGLPSGGLRKLESGRPQPDTFSNRYRPICLRICM